MHEMMTRDDRDAAQACSAEVTQGTASPVSLRGHVCPEALTTGEFETQAAGVLLQTPASGTAALDSAELVLSEASFETLELERPIGSGGIAEIWLARHSALEAPFVVKVARRELAENVHVHTQFEREWRATRLLRHPGVVGHYSRGWSGDGRPYLTMELVLGRSLAHFVHRPVTWRFLRAALLQLADILGFIHEHGVLHQDLKPSNLLIDLKRRRLRVTDFGLARFEAAEPGATTRSVLGTPAYMAPEQARGLLGALGPATELYTVGVLLYEILTGHKPFDDESERVVMIKHCTCAPPPLRVREGVDAPAGVLRLLDRLLAKSHQARFQTAAEFKQAVLAL